MNESGSEYEKNGNGEHETTDLKILFVWVYFSNYIMLNDWSHYRKSV